MKNQSPNQEPAGFLHEIGKQEKDRSKMQSFQDMFSPKFYYYEYSQEYLLAKVLSFVFSSVSIATGFFFLFTLFLIATGLEVLAIGFALIFLIALEYGKHLLFPKVLVRFYGTKHGYMGLAVINLALIAASVGLSVKGIEQYSRQVIAKKPALVNMDSLKVYYDNRLQKLENEKHSFQNAVSYLGKINIYDANTVKQLANFDKQILEVHHQQNQHLVRAQSDNNLKLSKAENHNNHNTFYLVLLCSLNEILCLFCLWYIVFYKFKSSEEIKLFLKNLKPIQVRMEDFPLLIDAVKTFLNPNEQKQLVQAKNDIGFQLNQSNKQSNEDIKEQSIIPKNQEKTKKKQGFEGYRGTFDNALDCLLSYPAEMISEIRKTEKPDFRTILKKYNVNPEKLNQVKEIISLMDNN